MEHVLGIGGIFFKRRGTQLGSLLGWYANCMIASSIEEAHIHVHPRHQQAIP